MPEDFDKALAQRKWVIERRIIAFVIQNLYQH